MTPRQILMFFWLGLSFFGLYVTYLVTENSVLASVLIFMIGALLGATLNYFQFGFSSSFRHLLIEHRTAGMRAIIWMLGLAIILFAPLLFLGHWQNQTFQGFIRPLSLSIPIGAFIFGIGMQISCGCTSGTLNRVGQMQPLALPTLLFMVIGGTLAAWSFSEWRELPALPPFAFHNQFGWLPGILLQLSIFALFYVFLIRREQRIHGNVEPLWKRGRSINFLLLAGVFLAVLNASLLLISGSPWSISSIFPYWGIKLIDLFSMPVDWRFWDYAMENQNSLASDFFSNTVSLTTMGVITGALMVSLVKPRQKNTVQFSMLAASMAGGFIMGFGAVMASGCNIGAFFSGIASGSLHGWIWFVFALAGNMIGLKLRQHIVR